VRDIGTAQGPHGTWHAGRLLGGLHRKPMGSFLGKNACMRDQRPVRNRISEKQSYAGTHAHTHIHTHTHTHTHTHKQTQHRHTHPNIKQPPPTRRGTQV